MAAEGKPAETGEGPRLAAVEAVLFDMDGTLVDSDDAVERAWVTWAGEYGVDPDSLLTIAHGKPADSTVRRLLPDLDEQAVTDAAGRQLSLQYEDLDDVVAASGAHSLLTTLDRRGVKWAVVTSADRRLAAARLRSAGIVAPLVVTIEDVRSGKPAPDGYLLAAHALGVEAGRCLVVEDTEPGLESARAAGMPTAAVKGLDADFPLRDLGELAALFQELPDSGDRT